MPDEPTHYLCCDEDRYGNRCSALGTLTESTRGTERWYCHKHFPPFRARDYSKRGSVPEQDRAP